MGAKSGQTKKMTKSVKTKSLHIIINSACKNQNCSGLNPMGGDYCQKFFIYLFYSHKNYNEGWWADYEGTAFVKMDDHSFPGSGIL